MSSRTVLLPSGNGDPNVPRSEIVGVYPPPQHRNEQENEMQADSRESNWTREFSDTYLRLPSSLHNCSRYLKESILVRQGPVSTDS